MTNETNQTAVDIAIEKCYQAIVDSKNPNSTTKRGGDYRIGLRKAIDILEELKEMEKKQMIEFAWECQEMFKHQIVEKFNEKYGE